MLIKDDPQWGTLSSNFKVNGIFLSRTLSINNIM